MKIGIPKEILAGERRVAALPETVEKYVKMGFEVAVETAAGLGVYRSDNDYEKAVELLIPCQAMFAKSGAVLAPPVHQRPTAKQISEEETQ